MVMRVLVTGAGGMSGARVVMELLARGWYVTAVVGRSDARLHGRSETNDRLTVVRCDLSEAADLPEPLDAIVHTAARSPGPGVQVDDLVRDNVLATRRLVAHAQRAGVRTFINFSSLSVYGRIAGAVVDESTPRVDPDVYGTTKFLGEQLVAAQGASFRSLSLRLPGILGPGAGRNWLTRVLAAARAGETVRIVNPDAPFNNAAHVDDLARLVADALDGAWTGADAVTLGAAEYLTVRDVVGTLVAATGGRSVVKAAPDGSGSFTVSSARAEALYGYRPMGIRAMLALYAAENMAPNTDWPVCPN